MRLPRLKFARQERKPRSTVLSAESTPTTPPPRIRWVPIDYSGPEPRFVYDEPVRDDDSVESE